ncbi:TPA: IS630 transposase-related protein [Legionella pneumophila]|uniref:IS630 transposase-related protein n=1 Tax=Legionella pneumophila TaxID=446 RepID=UPI0005AB2CDD|nr:IS630 transposase-related protein [Legionella pneumophila]
MTYSLDFREHVLRQIDNGGTLEAVSRLFSVGTTTIKNWKRLRAETGKLEGCGRPCNPYKIDAEALKLYIKERPDAFLNEIASHFGVTAPAIHTAMKRMNITRKKRSRSTKKDALPSAAITLK